MVLTVAIFGALWHYYAINIPKWDDHALRAFLYYSDQEPTFSGKVYQLFRQHNEHRIVYDRLITFLDYHLFGKLNFRHLMLVGNLSLVGLLAIFMVILRRHGQPLLATVPVALLLFNLSQWENMFWGMAALQNFSVVLWVLAALYFLSFTDWWILALASGVLATLTSGNGLLVWPIGFGLLLLRFDEPRSEARPTLRPLIGWLAGAVVVVGLYFTGFEKPGGIAYVRPDAVDLLKGWFAVVGAAAEALPTNSPLSLSILLGGLMTVTTLGIAGWELMTHRLAIVRVFERLFDRKTFVVSTGVVFPALTLFFWSSALFVLGTAAVVAWARTGFGAELLITSRYKLYSLTLLILLYVYGVVKLKAQPARWLTLGGVFGGLLFAWFSYGAFLDEAIWWRHWLTTNQFNWTYTVHRPVAKLDPITQRYTSPAPAFYDPALRTLYKRADQPPMVLTVTKTLNGFSIEEQTTPPLGLHDQGAYLVARSRKRVYLFPVWQNQRSGILGRLLPTRSFTAGFRANILSGELEAGTYRLLVLTVSAEQPYGLHLTNQSITSAGQSGDTTTKNW
ncbi:hypothetical protein HNV11_15230 [Spirosoma taeanense]|uniref:Glycosyltransferase RgtA/B/C/D-like domain-containing protein n=1 Tax=Spirosoma taeanense TaxID=2735870 RepID=A0A6M5YHE3_9BACT|nr:hypothetical protein HNV11_15230 [Spirosoma taeanense]